MARYEDLIVGNLTVLGELLADEEGVVTASEVAGTSNGTAIAVKCARFTGSLDSEGNAIVALAGIDATKLVMVTALAQYVNEEPPISMWVGPAYSRAGGQFDCVIMRYPTPSSTEARAIISPTLGGDVSKIVSQPYVISVWYYE